MNYNNFASRISAPRVHRISDASVPASAPTRKPKKRTRRPVATAAILLFAFLFLSCGAGVQAADSGSPLRASPAFISSPALQDASNSFGKDRLSPITAALLSIGLTVAAIQARLLFGRGELDC